MARILKHLNTRILSKRKRIETVEKLDTELTQLVRAQSAASYLRPGGHHKAYSSHTDSKTHGVFEEERAGEGGESVPKRMRS